MWLWLEGVGDPSPSAEGMWKRLLLWGRGPIGCVATICRVAVTIATYAIVSVAGRHRLAVGVAVVAAVDCIYSFGFPSSPILTTIWV